MIENLVLESEENNLMIKSLFSTKSCSCFDDYTLIKKVKQQQLIPSNNL